MRCLICSNCEKMTQTKEILFRMPLILSMADAKLFLERADANYPCLKEELHEAESYKRSSNNDVESQ